MLHPLKNWSLLETRGGSVHESDDSEHAVNLLRRTALAKDLHTLDCKPPVLHGDNGAALKATRVLVMMSWLGRRASYPGPRGSATRFSATQRASEA